MHQYNGDTWHLNPNLIFKNLLVNEIKFGPLKVGWTRFFHMHQEDDDTWQFEPYFIIHYY
jgi:hypothetical protein